MILIAIRLVQLFLVDRFYVGAVIDMKEGNIKFQFPLTKGMEHFSGTRIRPPYESIMRASYGSRTKYEKT